MRRTRPGHGVEHNVPKTHCLNPSKVAAGQGILGTPNATATILDLVVLRQELVEGTRAMLGVARRLRSRREPCR
jgi:hypothetical protein